MTECSHQAVGEHTWHQAPPSEVKKPPFQFFVLFVSNIINFIILSKNFFANFSELHPINRKNGWLFNWNSEYKKFDRDVYKLTISSNVSIIQGLISLTEKKDHVFIHLIESAPFNRGKNKIYLGVPGNLVAFACKISFHRGFEGYVSFRSKSDLIEHYEKILEAVHIGGQLMIINTFSAQKLIDIYFKE